MEHLMNSLVPYIPLIIKGTGVTIFSWLCASGVSLTVGVLFGIFSCRYLATRWTIAIVRLYTFIAKGVPAYVQILIAYFVIPALLGIQISGFIAATGALALCSGGYVTEIIRAGINNVPRGQWDACFVLGYPLHTTLHRIILPQAIRAIIPTLFGELEQLLKSTSLLATIGVAELTRTGMNIISRELNPLPVYCMIALIYLLLSTLLNIASARIERKNQYDYR
jgi:His/Glu/Gln/Arg/opine family amino acid ABC transporter permease subunit